MKTKLSPCPFCGGRAKVFSSNHGMDWNNGVSCKCGINAYFFDKHGINVAHLKDGTREHEHNEIAKAWNKRAKAKRRGKG